MIPVHSLSLQLSGAKSKLHGVWIFSNQVQHLEDALLDSGRSALVEVPQLGCMGIYNKSSLISVRLLPKSVSQNVIAQILKDSSGQALSKDVLVGALAAHLQQIRAQKENSFSFVEREAFRWIHGDSDGIPSVVVDDYGSVIVLQSGSAAGDFLLPYVSEALAKTDSRPQFERSSGQARKMEGLSERVRWLSSGDNLNSLAAVHTQFAGLSLSFELNRAQKTGLFLDQRLNLRLLGNVLAARKTPLRSMLDVCSYAGAWSSVGAQHGILDFALIDVDKQALSLADANVKANAKGAVSVSLHHGDMFEQLAKLRDENRKFDVIVADPPAFAKSRKHVPEASRAYGRLVRLASRLLAPKGILVVCSCSRNMEEANFLEIIRSQLQSEDWICLGRGQQSPDHTVAMHSPEADYLKCFLFQKRDP